MDYIVSTSRTQATKIHKDLSLAIFVIKPCTIPKLQPPFAGLKKTCKHINVLRDTCLGAMTEFWLPRKELLKFLEVLPLWPIVFRGWLTKLYSGDMYTWNLIYLGEGATYSLIKSAGLLSCIWPQDFLPSSFYFKSLRYSYLRTIQNYFKIV